ncbi:PREDICTED: uncharacterized protein LOC109356281 [Lupinus angustifolius]|uniref:uncharacterized protein LOC109356281 n=1 Tax=Lupinus angustifolius TaxID=3871 RepID=UPI00092E961B|nr:PREDICTED: uncharacterized protein LOC109356281 [Lupinus angustifolius]
MSFLSLRSILTDGKLVGDNFHDWYRTLRIVLMHEKLIDMIDKPPMPEPIDNDDVDAVGSYKKYLEDLMSTKCLMLASMSSELQRQHEDMDPTDIIAHLKKMYGAQSRTTRYQLSKTLFRFMLMKMISLMEQLEKLGCKLGKELSQDLILQSLPESFSPFIVNFNMNKMDCDLHEMLNMLIDYQNQIDSGKNQGSVLVVGKSNKKKGKWNNKSKKKPFAPKSGVTKPREMKGDVDQSNAECFFYKEKGH